MPSTLVIPFARNRLCVLSRTSLGSTAESVVDRMMDPAFRLATSTPGADPGGDHAWQVFEKAEVLTLPINPSTPPGHEPNPLLQKAAA